MRTKEEILEDKNKLDIRNQLALVGAIAACAELSLEVLLDIREQVVKIPKF